MKTPLFGHLMAIKLIMSIQIFSTQFPQMYKKRWKRVHDFDSNERKTNRLQIHIHVTHTQNVSMILSRQILWIECCCFTGEKWSPHIIAVTLLIFLLKIIQFSTDEYSDMNTFAQQDRKMLMACGWTPHFFCFAIELNGVLAFF